MEWKLQRMELSTCMQIILFLLNIVISMLF